jgi:hypothetical protein
VSDEQLVAEVKVPRDTAGTFEPQIVKKRQRRLTGVDEMVLSLSAKGLTHGEISAHLAEVYGAEVSKQTISTITDKVMDGMAEWQNRPLDRGRFPLIVANQLEESAGPRGGRPCNGCRPRAAWRSTACRLRRRPSRSRRTRRRARARRGCLCDQGRTRSRAKRQE